MNNASAPEGPQRPGFLTGLKVFEFGDGVAGAAATSLLRALGADVTAVVSPASPHRHGRPSVPVTEAPGSLLSVILDRGKHLIAAPTLELASLKRLIMGDRKSGNSAFDLVVVDRVNGFQGELESIWPVDVYAAFVDSVNPGAWLTISAFGLSGERRADTASELTLAAASGVLLSVSDPQTGYPLKLAGFQSLLNAGQAAALAWLPRR